jgi:hypothetical protein
MLIPPRTRSPRSPFPDREDEALKGSRITYALLTIQEQSHLSDSRKAVGASSQEALMGQGSWPRDSPFRLTWLARLDWSSQSTMVGAIQQSCGSE